MSYRQSIRVRYGECDMQRVVFNANYFVYCDDVVDSWTRIALADELRAAGTATDLHAIGFDFMLKKTELTWTSPVRFGDTIDATAAVTRWGNSSFDVSILGEVDGTTKFEAVITYVSIDPITQRPAPIPEVVRRALDRDLG
jgi:acyl-CoA thioester hydrolase